jgi:hypothetical protein
MVDRSVNATQMNFAKRPLVPPGRRQGTATAVAGVLVPPRNRAVAQLRRLPLARQILEGVGVEQRLVELAPLIFVHV